jgi:hypothetical protein
MDQVGAKIAGVVMNDLPKEHDHYGVYHYYYRREGSEKSPEKSSRSSLKMPWLKGASAVPPGDVQPAVENLNQPPNL